MRVFIALLTDFDVDEFEENLRERGLLDPSLEPDGS